VTRDLRDDRGQGSYAQVIMSGNGEVMLAMLRRGQADVAASLASDPIAERSQGPCKIVPRDVRGAVSYGQELLAHEV
jgi:ABC-type phosphate/phosphonate transport system substrate-binding protein